ncbi:MAG TPA: hypothetical protein VLI44_11200 [Sporolactobacillaceae bacterium]|nr:hypothetical protein [Sporolactobacillaceae bacterium]
MAKDLSRVKTVVIAILENRSFDRILGHLELRNSEHPLTSGSTASAPSVD